METETRYQRIAREQRERADARLAATKKKIRRNPCRRIADRIDGYDRDDIGLSPDY